MIDEIDDAVLEAAHSEAEDNVNEKRRRGVHAGLLRVTGRLP
jgi:hypothetical protein